GWPAARCRAAPRLARALTFPRARRAPGRVRSHSSGRILPARRAHLVRSLQVRGSLHPSIKCSLRITLNQSFAANDEALSRIRHRLWIARGRHSDLYGAFPVKSFFGLLSVLCSERESGSSSRRLRSGLRSARKGSRDRNASRGLAACRLAGLVFRSALTPEHAQRR